MASRTIATSAWKRTKWPFAGNGAGLRQQLFATETSRSTLK
jgi:hypothetical protein